MIHNFILLKIIISIHENLYRRKKPKRVLIILVDREIPCPARRLKYRFLSGVHIFRNFTTPIESILILEVN